MFCFLVSFVLVSLSRGVSGILINAVKIFKIQVVSRFSERKQALLFAQFKRFF